MRISEKQFRTLVHLAKKVLWTDVRTRRRIQEAGFHIIPADFYASIPTIEDVENSFEYDRSQEAPYLAGGLFDRDRIAGFTEQIAAYADEFDPPADGEADGSTGYYWNNPAFSRCDAMAYYCVLRALRPQRVLEVGSGYSTLVADMALRANTSGELVIIEPYPKDFLAKLETLGRLIREPVQNIPAQELVALVESSQVWFIDSTHTVKAGSDCLYLYLKIMPLVGSDVLCHSHDIYLPYAMPPSQALERNVYWTEQYLLQAYLLDNPKAEILFGSYYLHREMRAVSEAFMRGRHADGGASLWYRLNGGGRPLLPV